MALELEQVADGLGFPEGPVAMDDGSVLFVDIAEQLLRRLMPGGSLVDVARLPGGPNGVAIGPDGAAYICNNGGVYSFVKIPAPGWDPQKGPPPKITIPSEERPHYQGGSIERVDLKTGAVTPLYSECDGKRLIAPDDIVFDEHAGFWFTDTGKKEGSVMELGAVYYATRDGTKLQHVADIPTANGIGLSPDGNWLYVSDTIFGRLWKMKITGPGRLQPGPLPGIPGHVVQTLPGLQWLDSLKVQADGHICVGTLFTGGITRFSPDGKEVEHFAVPDPFTTNLCFGGDDMRDVWITASGTGKIYKTRWDRPGLKLHAKS